MNSAPAYAVADQASVIHELAILRELASFGQQATVVASSDMGSSAFIALASIRHSLDEIEAGATPTELTMIDAPAAAELAVARMEDMARHGKKRGKLTGLRCVDRRLGGLRPGALVVIGGRPGMGKTSVARAVAHGAAVRNPNEMVLFCGIEMSPEEMMHRELSALTYEYERETAVEYRAMGNGEMTAQDFASVIAARSRVPRNLILDDCNSLSVEDVRRKVWGLKRKGEVAAVVIDYLQLMRRPPGSSRNESLLIGDMTSALKQIARQSQICIVLLSQLSRAVESREDKRPQLSDLRESGSIEQDADAVLFPYREIYYLERNEPKDPTKRDEWEIKCDAARFRLDVICAKQRMGAVGTDTQEYRAPFDFIADLRGQP